MKDVEWSDIFGEGEIVASCDNCGKEERYEFTDNFPDYRAFQEELKDLGWKPCKVHGNWYDFCCEKCRNEYIKNNA